MGKSLLLAKPYPNNVINEMEQVINIPAPFYLYIFFFKRSN